MDKKELIEEVLAFIEYCKSQDFPLSYCELCEAYPGDSTTSYILNVGASWVENYDCYEVIDKLSDFMWEAMSIEARSRIFSIRLYTDDKTFYCSKEGSELLLKSEEGEGSVPV